MIPRYESPEMAKVWSEENKLAWWSRVEANAAEAMAKHSVIPQQAADEISRAADYIRKNAEVVKKEVWEREVVTKHDLAAFVDIMSERVSEECSRWVHYGLTSSDIVDTAFVFQISEASNLIHKASLELLGRLLMMSKEFVSTPMMGRTHGMWAEPTTFGLILRRWGNEINKRMRSFVQIGVEPKPLQMSGAVGTYSHVGQDVEFTMLTKHHGYPGGLASQIIGRDYHAEVMSKVALYGAALENIAVTLRGMQRSEVGEVYESFNKGQKGSSAMPHKKNPILSENITGLARVLRGYAITAMENVALWHERDISHSSAERMIFPDAFGLLHFMIKRMSAIIGGLQVDRARMLENIMATQGRWATQGVMLMLIRKGKSREEAYRFVQSISSSPYHFEEVMRAELKELGIQKKDIDECFSLDHHLRNIT